MLLTEVRDPEADVEPILSDGTGLLPPVWDAADRIWMVNRPARGAQIAVYDDGRRREVDVPGISGEKVSQVLVSRDGSRMIAVRDRRAG